ncbi:MAG: hypothetical protein ACJ70W_04865 [Nitrososphaera sp.]
MVTEKNAMILFESRNYSRGAVWFLGLAENNIIFANGKSNS